MKKLAACGSGGRSSANASRNLQKLMSKEGKFLPIPISHFTVPVRMINKGRPRKQDMEYPTLLPSSWLQVSLQTGGQAFLGGHSIHEESKYRAMLSEFWQRYRALHPSFHFFARDDYNEKMASLSVPILVHGDEGRGKSKRPIMIVAIQPLISWKGPSQVNSSGYLGNRS